MINFTDLMGIAFFLVLLVLCLFVVVHTVLQINTCQYNTFSTGSGKNKKEQNKMYKILIIGVALFVCILFKIMSNATAYKANTEAVDTYKDTVAELSVALSLGFSNQDDEDLYSSAQKLAKLINSQLPIMESYYLESQYNPYNEFAKTEIYQFNLNDFVNKPTLVTYDGILMSVIKFKEGCKYTNKTFIGKSDCLIEVDINHYNKPNQIGQDRTLLAIDGKRNKIIADKNFFNK